MTAKKLVQQYVSDWKKGDLRKITEILTDNCIIIESHGPKYKGLKEIIQWIKKWNKEKSKVNTWNITSFYQTKNIAVFEWKFLCTVDGKIHNIDGISIAKIKNNKISYLREYRTIKS